MDLHLRIATNSDFPLFEQMLYEAAFWRPGAERPPLNEALAHPELAKILADWGREGDAGIVAESDDGTPLGAAFYRCWTEDNHTYGFVDADTPEFAIGVKAAHRGQGIGSALLEALAQHAKANGFTRLSLSVEKDNPALRLYKRNGYETVDSEGNSWTMVKNL